MAIDTSSQGGFPQQEGDGEDPTTGTTTGTTAGTTTGGTATATTTGDGHLPRVGE